MQHRPHSPLHERRCDCSFRSSCRPPPPAAACAGTRAHAQTCAEQCSDVEVCTAGTCCTAVGICNGSCCPPAELCTNANTDSAQCAAPSQVCGAAVCDPSAVCLNGACCPSASVCGQACCQAGEVSTEAGAGSNNMHACCRAECTRHARCCSPPAGVRRRPMCGCKRALWQRRLCSRMPARAAVRPRQCAVLRERRRAASRRLLQPASHVSTAIASRGCAAWPYCERPSTLL